MPPDDDDLPERVAAKARATAAELDRLAAGLPPDGAERLRRAAEAARRVAAELDRTTTSDR